jgi:hypothetical protein
MNAVRDAGFVAAFGIDERWVDRASDRFDLPRLIIHASDRGWRFRFRTTAPALYEQLDVAQGRVRASLRKFAASISGKG